MCRNRGIRKFDRQIFESGLLVMGLIALRCMERRMRLDAEFMGSAVWVRFVMLGFVCAADAL